MGSRWLWIALSLGLIVVGWGGWSRVSERRYRRELAEANREMASGLHQLAAATSFHADGATAERGRGRLSTRFMRGSPWSFPFRRGLLVAYSHRTARSPTSPLWHARLFMNAGRFAPAETLLLSVPRGRRPESDQANQALQVLYHFQGRIAEIRELIKESWAQSVDPAIVLRKLYVLDHSTFPVDHIRKTLQNADPQDNRVWLGQANLAAWTGQLDEASRWLARCSQSRPDDEPIWHARLAAARGRPGDHFNRHAGGRSSLTRSVHSRRCALASRVAGRSARRR